MILTLMILHSNTELLYEAFTRTRTHIASSSLFHFELTHYLKTK